MPENLFYSHIVIQGHGTMSSNKIEQWVLTQSEYGTKKSQGKVNLSKLDFMVEHQSQDSSHFDIFASLS